MATSSRKPEAASNPLPEKIGFLLQESRWLLVGALALFLGMSLWGYHREDPSWSHATGDAVVLNPAGRAGAWVSDILLYVFGLSAWWWIVLCLMFVWWGYRRLNGPGMPKIAEAREKTGERGAAKTKGQDRRAFYLAIIGFFLLLFASSALEALRFHAYALTLPGHPGGIAGQEVAARGSALMGHTGATLLLLVTMAVGWSVFVGMSWLWFFERLGAALERVYLWALAGYERWQDQRIGRSVAEQRDAVVEQEKRRGELKEPLWIEPSAPVEKVSGKAEKRIGREKQSALFPEALAGGQLPPLHLLDAASTQGESVAADTLEFTSRLIERKLAEFGVQVKVLAALPGPVITRYEIEPATGVKGAQIVNLGRDLARALALVSIRVVETVPGKSCMALELPNARRQAVKLSEIIASKVWNDLASPLTITLGKDIGGLPVVADLAKMPHLLVAGTTGSGKSVGVNAMILSLLYKSEPENVRLILIDPKMLELSIYEGIPHLLAPVVTDMRQAANALNWCVGEMERRYKLMSALGVRNLAGFNSKIREAKKRSESLPNPFTLTPESPEPLTVLPYIVVVIDELADLMMVVGKKVEELIARLAQKARAAGLHLVLATQRPSVDVITGLIKANIPTRISFQVSSKIDSRTVLDQMGAENLLGQGDMLYLAPGTGYPVRVHGAFVADDEVHRVVEHLKQIGEPEYIPDVLVGSPDDGDDAGGGEEGGENVESDPMYDRAVEVVLKSRRASISLVQRQLRIGYNRAARFIEAMERAGLVSAVDGRGGREVLVKAPEAE
ncbi:MAG: DNA translocase FtsK 4TM domain-containing protein [Zoogloeaceae bacterium]|jgi:S-DNA-T family DNA segregation ATPase FtsK/SpoIIIE|nr:DNA translocase FtsK 4TM domain-containing protein [Zoogloeaceae bacterium]